MRTLVVSDLHLGSADDADLLRRPAPRAALVAALRGIDRLVLLGDTIEGRHGRQADVLDRARPVLAEIGAAMAAGEIVLVPGNHDHELAARWLEHGPELRLEERREPHAASPAATELEAALAPARVVVAYPGLWLRDDVYATHGHYLDMHTTVPVLERLAAGAMARLSGPVPVAGAAPSDYERVLAPMYAWMYAAAARARADRAAAGTSRSPGLWDTLNRRGRRSLRDRAVCLAFPVAVAAANRLGLGPVRTDVSTGALRDAGLAAMREVVRRLGVDAGHVIFGHTHRTGPLPEDDHAAWGPLMNTGSWVVQEHFTSRTGTHGPYGPGGAVEVGPEGPPVLRRLLGDLPDAELRAPARP